MHVLRSPRQDVLVRDLPRRDYRALRSELLQSLRKDLDGIDLDRNGRAATHDLRANL